MIIGFDGSRAFTDKKTGTENYSFQLLKALSKIDSHNNYIIYTRSGVNIGKNWPNNFQFSIVNFQFLWTQIGLAKQTFQDKLDVLFIPAHTSPLIHKPGLKTVVTVHDLGAEYLPKMHQLKQQLYLKYITKYQLRSATKLIAVSKATKEDLLKKAGVDEKKIEVVYEGFDKKLFKPTIPDVLVTSLRQYYLFVGTIQPRKNLERLIRAFSSVILNEAKRSEGSLANANSPNKLGDSSLIAQNDKIKLVIVGSKGWLSEDIYKLPKKLGIEERVKFLGYVPDEKMPALYSNAIALVFPSLFEGFGLPILEAQACGCPVITSNASSMPEIAGKGAILVDPLSVKDIMEGMERLQAFGSEAQARRVTGYRLQLIKKGFENIKRFSWEKCARETLKVLEEVRVPA